MRALLLLVALLLSLALRASAIAVVYAERSVPEGERRFAKALAVHVQRWYAEAGVETDLVADGALKKVRPRLAVLVDCYAPPADVVEAVRKRLAGGTRFVVCYSGSDALARLFGLRAGAYRRSSGGAWSKMAFAAQRPSGAPKEILQTSSNLFTVMPLPSNGAKPMAWWLDRQGRRTEVAWWKAPNGSYWMTHVLSGDGDEEAKRRLLLAFAGECVPGVWRAAAQHLYREASAPLEDGSLLARIRLLPKTSPRRQRLDGLYEGLLRQQAAVREALGKDAFAAYQAVCDLRDVTARVYGMTYWSRPNEIRGVWDHSGQGLFPGDWERTAALLAASGITDLYVNVAGAAFALYLETANKTIYPDGAQYKSLWPDDCPLDDSARQQIIDQFYNRITNVVPPQYWLRRWHALIRRNSDKWVKLIRSEGLLQDRDATNNYYIEETSDFTSSATSSSESSNQTTGTSTATSYQSDTPDGSVGDIEHYMSAAAKSDSVADSQGNGTSTGTNSSTGQTTTHRTGNIGVQTAADIIGGYRDAINYTAFNTIFAELEPMFMQLWGDDFDGGYFYQTYP